MRTPPSLRRLRQTALLSALALGACGGATASSEAPNDRDATTDAPPGDAAPLADASTPDAGSCATLVADNVLSSCIAENCCAPFLASLGAPSCPAYGNCLVACPNEAGADVATIPGKVSYCLSYCADQNPEGARLDLSFARCAAAAQCVTRWHLRRHALRDGPLRSRSAAPFGRGKRFANPKVIVSDCPGKHATRS